MEVNICKWKYDVNSPVIFMIDDLSNTWIDLNGNGIIETVEDWGFAKRQQGSVINYLEKEILEQNEDIKVTFYLPVGKRCGVVRDSKVKVISEPINSDQNTSDFFKNLSMDTRFEIAYHGTTHGVPRSKSSEFIQEWLSYSSLTEAISVIEDGKRIYNEVFGEMPLGGKYCGYSSNEFSDESIDRSGFMWWNRYWNRGIDDGEVSQCGSDNNRLTNYDIKYFGNNKIIDIPSTVNGALLTDIYSENVNCKTLIKKIIKPVLKRKRLKSIDFLLKNKLIISIQEHISPSRNDGRIQNPNIISDTKSLRSIFNYLKSKNVWYCTCTELAKYVYSRDNSIIKIIDNKSFMMDFNNWKKIDKCQVTLNIDTDYKFLISPSNKYYRINNNTITLFCENGTFYLTNN